MSLHPGPDQNEPHEKAELSPSNSALHALCRQQSSHVPRIESVPSSAFVRFPFSGTRTSPSGSPTRSCYDRHRCPATSGTGPRQHQPHSKHAPAGPAPWPGPASPPPRRTRILGVAVHPRYRGRHASVGRWSAVGRQIRVR